MVDFSAVEVSEAKATYLAFKNQPNLKQIEAKKNELTYEGIDLLGAPNLVTLDLSYNKITRLDLRNFKKLTNFTANHNTILATVFISRWQYRTTKYRHVRWRYYTLLSC